MWRTGPQQVGISTAEYYVVCRFEFVSINFWLFLQTAPNDISPDDAPGLQRVMEGLALSIQQKKVDKYRQTGVLEVIFC